MRKHFRLIVLVVTALVCGVARAQAGNKVVANVAQQLTEGFIPCPVQDFTAKWVEVDGKNNVEISFVTPTEMISEWDYSTKAPLSASITKVELMRSIGGQGEYEVIATFDNPKAGERLSWTDMDLGFGSYDYMAQVYVDEARDWANVETVVVGQLPIDLEPGQFTATIDKSNPYNVILEVTLPTLNSLSEPLTMPITKVEFGELGTMSFEPVIFYTEDAEEVLIPGSKLQYVVEKVTDGSHLYSVQIYTATGSNFPTNCAVFVGSDQPGRAKNVKAELTEEGIKVTWEAPTEGMNGGAQGDPANFTYTVKRGTDIYDANAVVIAEGIKEFSVVDKTEFTEESKFVYLVTVKSPYGEGYATSSNVIVVGPSAQLPFAENFDVPFDEWGNTTTQHSTWSKENSGYFCAWSVGQDTYVGETLVTPHSGAGILYAYYNRWGTTHQWDSYTSGSIDFSKAESPELTFWLYDTAKGGTDVTLKIQTSTDAVEFTTIETIVMGNAEETGWREVTVKLDAVKGAQKGKVRFLSEANGSNCFALAIDDILIQDGISDAIAAVNATGKKGLTFNQLGQRVGKNAKGIVIVASKKYIAR